MLLSQALQRKMLFNRPAAFFLPIIVRQYLLSLLEYLIRYDSFLLSLTKLFRVVNLKRGFLIAKTYLKLYNNIKHVEILQPCHAALNMCDYMGTDA